MICQTFFRLFPSGFINYSLSICQEWSKRYGVFRSYIVPDSRCTKWGSLLLVSNLGTRPATSLSFLTSYWLDAAEGTNYIKATNPWGPTVLLLPSPIMILMIDPVGSNGLLLCKLYRISGFSILRPSPDWSCRKQTQPQITVDYIYIYNPVLSRVSSRIPDLALYEQIYRDLEIWVSMSADDQNQKSWILWSMQRSQVLQAAKHWITCSILPVANN